MIAKTNEIGDWHTHNSLCRHAVGVLEEYVIEGINKNLQIIGLSDHFPNEYLKEDGTLSFKQYAMKDEEISLYLKQAKILRAKYKDVIKIKIGFEVGYFEGKEKSLFHKLNLYSDQIDYLIGSVHVIKIEGKYYGVKNGDIKPLFQKYEPKYIYSLYFKTLRKMLSSKYFDLDIIGHLDFIKNGTESHKLNKFILKEVRNSIDLIKDRNVAVEINAQGLRNDYKKLYPCKKIIKLLYENDIPILLSSDAHDPSQVGTGFEKILTIIKKTGFTKISKFSKRIRRESKIF